MEARVRQSYARSDLYLVSFWLPTIIRETGIAGVIETGFLTGVPGIVAIVLMLLITSSSDHRHERRFHLMVALIMAGASLGLATLFIHDTVIALSLFTIANAFVFAGFPVFWAIPTGMLRGRAAAAGIGLINSIANLGGFLATFFIGWLKDLTHSVTSGLLVFSVLALLAAIVVYRLPRSSPNGQSPDSLIGSRHA
jgi:cyanate permease